MNKEAFNQWINSLDINEAILITGILSSLYSNSDIFENLDDYLFYIDVNSSLKNRKRANNINQLPKNEHKST